MRLRNALALAALATAATVPVAHALTAAAGPAAVLPAGPAPAVLAPAVPVPPAPPAPALAALAPTCGDAADPEFPLGAGIRGGPEEYAAGGTFRTWHLVLGNRTAAPCRGVHPVLVLVDSRRSLKPEQIRAEFYDEEARLWRPVAFEATDRAENVGVFADGSPSATPASPTSPTSPARPTSPTRPASPTSPSTPATPTAPSAPATSTATAPAFGGFAVPAGGTLTVPVRLAFRADAAPDDDVVVNAAVVQRRGDDGDWVGESGGYRLAIGPADPDADAGLDPGTAPSPDPSGPARPTAPGTGVDPRFPELAQSGRESTLRHAPAAAALVAAGAALVLLVRRFRNP
ncbi:hypothetical protein ABZ135_07615 [Streptomyces sp. NPDC006339]|uniref:hypothetical protein n=1 Tax=Streptomyces sp. NPDC006339 TaxID=3156755 RepID=UPI00339E1A29